MLLPGPAQVVASAPNPPYPGGGSWISPFGQGNAQQTPVVGTLYAFAFVVPTAVVCTGIGIQLQNAPSVDAIVRCGVYSPVSPGYGPSTNIIDSGDIATGASSGPKTATVASVGLPAGLNFAAYCFTTATTLTNAVSVGLGSGSTGPSMLMPARGFVYYGNGATPSVALGNDGTVFTQTGVGVGAALPLTFTGSWVGNSNAPARPATIYLRIG